MVGLELVNTIILIGALLVILGIASSLVATRFGVPLLLVFLVLGMLAGVDGPGGIAFENYQLTYLVGSLALSVILFDGGLRTRLSTFRGVLGPALLLATFGVVVTAGLAGLAAWLVLEMTPLEALLLGTIVASTDAAAVFFLLRTGGMRLQRRVGSTLEIESGTNDPIAVFLVLVLTEYLLAGGDMPTGELVLRLGQQGVVGALAGVAGGALAVAVLNRVAMPGGLHPLFAVTSALLIYGATSLMGGSGLLAAYLAGLVMANRPTRAYPTIVGFHDAITWLSQIVMFLVLGLLVTPSTLWNYVLPGMVVALALILVARPVAVWLCLTPFGYARREKLFISWVGLRGAVSIFLAAIPTLAGVPDAQTFFNIAFFVVLVSMLLQGSTLTAAARRLGLALRQSGPAPTRVELDIPGQTEMEIVGYPVGRESVILGLSRLPAWARTVMVVRGGDVLEPSAAGHLQAGDYAYFLAPRERLSRLDSLFRASPDVTRRLGLAFGELPIRGDTAVGDVAEFYGLDFGAADPGQSIAEWAAERLDHAPELDEVIAIPGAKLVVRRIEGARIASVGLQLDEVLRVEPDEGLFDRLEEEELGPLGRWLARLRRRRA